MCHRPHANYYCTKYYPPEYKYITGSLLSRLKRYQPRITHFMVCSNCIPTEQLSTRQLASPQSEGSGSSLTSCLTLSVEFFKVPCRSSLFYTSTPPSSCSVAVGSIGSFTSLFFQLVAFHKFYYVLLSSFIVFNEFNCKPSFVNWCVSLTTLQLI